MRRSQRLAWLIIAPLIVLTISVTVPVALDETDWTRNVEYAPLFVVMLTVLRVNLLRIDVRRRGMDITLGDLPVLIALFYLPPVTLLIVGLVSLTVIQCINRPPLVKAVFNVVAFVTGTACANLVVYSFGITGTGPRTWAVLAFAVGVHTHVTLLAVVAVVALVQGAWNPRQLRLNIEFGTAVMTVNIAVGLIVVLTLQANAWSALLIAGLAALLIFGYRSYTQFVRQHRSLMELYDLTQALAATGPDGTLFDMLLTRVQALTQAESSTLWLPEQGRHPEVLLSARMDFRGLLDSAPTPDSLRRHTLEGGQTVVVTPKLGPEDLRQELLAQGIRDAIVVPLRSGGVCVGTLEIASRLGDRTLIGSDEVRLVETLAAHAAVAVENSRLVDRLRFDASHDPLTGLPNRRRMLDALDAALTAPAVGDVVAVLLFDVVGLRNVNESLGQAAGDQVLVEVARRLRAASPAGAMLARVGGNEFVLEVRVPEADAVLAMAESIREQLRNRMALGALMIDMDTSVGIAIHPEHGDDAEVLLRRAEVAAHVAKRRAAVQLFSSGLESRSVRRFGLAGDLRRALDAGDFEVYFQPKVAISDRRLVGVECLARWEHPVHGSVAPQDVGAGAEYTGELPRFTEFVLSQGLRRAREWADSGRTITVAVNVAVRTLLDATFPDLVQRLLVEYGVAPEALTLEIAEEALAANSERPLPTLHHLRDLGVRLSIDDFGSGYSSLAYIGSLPVQELKVDRMFVQGATTDPRDLAVVRTVVDMARHFGLVAVAEGVESELTLGVLADVGCDIGQGFLFSRPLPYERFDAWLRGQGGGADNATVGDVRWLRAVP